MVDLSWRRKWPNYVSFGSMLLSLAATCPAGAVPLDANDQSTTTPIQHVVVIIGENRTFDHIYGAYRPRPGEKVLNLLSQGIIKFDGTPGPKFDKAAQFTAQVTSSYTPAPSDQKTAYLKLPPVFSGGNQTASDTNGPPFQS